MRYAPVTLGAVHQRVDRVRVRAGPLDPEFGEVGEFLAARQPGVDREPARGQAVLVLRAGGAEIGGALERHPVAGPARRHRAEPGDAERGGVALFGLEQVARELDAARLPVLDDVDRDRHRRIAAEREQADTARQRLVGAEADAADLVVIDRGGGGDLGGSGVWLGGKRRGTLLERVPRERLGLAGRCTHRGGGLREDTQQTQRGHYFASTDHAERSLVVIMLQCGSIVTARARVDRSRRGRALSRGASPAGADPDRVVDVAADDHQHRAGTRAEEADRGEQERKRAGCRVEAGERVDRDDGDRERQDTARAEAEIGAEAVGVGHATLQLSLAA